MNSNTHSFNLWQDFKSALKNQLEKDKEKIEAFFKIPANRKYYFKKNFKEIAETLNLIYKYDEEFLRIDYAFFKKGSKYGWRVPQILVESENIYNSIFQEILKLCSLNVPLKVLIIYADLENEKIKKDV